MKLIRYLFIFPILLYQKMVSPFLPSNCNYYPTCSEYTKIAVRDHGVLRGLVMGTLRIGRCSAGFFGGYDPVPSKFDLVVLRGEYRERSVRNHRRAQKKEDPRDG